MLRLNTFVLKMAWRDARTEYRKLLLFASAIIAGVAALVAVNSMADNLRNEVSRQAKTLLGADLVLESRQGIADSIADSVGSGQIEARSRETSFPSMVLFPKNGSTRLSQIRALEGNYPFYGEFDTRPENARDLLRYSGNALIDATLSIQFDVTLGDSVQIGDMRFLVAGILDGIPGEAAAASLVGPRVYIPMQDLEATRLIQYGSIVTYKEFWKLNETAEPKQLSESVEAIPGEHRIRTETVDDRQNNLNNAVANVSRFLNITGYMALLLGAIGIASSIHVYARRKFATVAILRCLGMQADDAIAIFFWQTLVFGIAGTLIGALLGILLQVALPGIMGDLFPVDVSFEISIPSAIGGLITGIVISTAFSLFPLLQMRRVSPLRLLNRQAETSTPEDKATLGLVVALLLATILFAVWQMNDIRYGFALAAGTWVLGLALLGLGKLIVMAASRISQKQKSYIFRQGLANLHRPQNQTSVLLLSLGFGVTLVLTQLIIQHSLLREITVAGSEGQANLIIFDVQNDQKEDVVRLLSEVNLPPLSDAPVVTMRISSINGRSAAEMREDSTLQIPRWALGREYRSTYRNHLTETETLIRGEFTSSWNGSGPVPVSFEADIARDLGIDIGDQLTLDIQGVPLHIIVGSIRQVDWRRIQPNFFMVFPDGPLNAAPQFFIMVAHADTPEKSALAQRNLIAAHPNVSAIDLDLILSTVDTILSKISWVIQFMAAFSILTGLIVLSGAVLISRYQRIRENVLLRTLGASKRQIIGITLIEYVALSAIASLAGILLSIIISALVMIPVFETALHMPWTEIVFVWIATVVITAGVAWFNSRSATQHPPLEVLRNGE